MTGWGGAIGAKGGGHVPMSPHPKYAPVRGGSCFIFQDFYDELASTGCNCLIKDLIFAFFVILSDTTANMVDSFCYISLHVALQAFVCLFFMRIKLREGA